jgi:hypothetical protein
MSDTKDTAEASVLTENQEAVIAEVDRVYSVAKLGSRLAKTATVRRLSYLQETLPLRDEKAKHTKRVASIKEALITGKSEVPPEELRVSLKTAQEQVKAASKVITEKFGDDKVVAETFAKSAYYTLLGVLPAQFDKPIEPVVAIPAEIQQASKKWKRPF